MDIVFGPASEKQRLALAATEDVVLTGGGAGSGKSTCCLMRNLDGIDDPLFSAVVIRKTNPELKQTGGLVSESQSIYSHFGGKFNKQSLTWTFPSGATIEFMAVPDKKSLGKRLGMQTARIIIDEVGDDGWDMETVLFLLGRLRKKKACEVPEQFFMTCNPRHDSFLKEWLAYILDADGVPKPGTENVVKWFVVLNGKVLWHDNPRQLYEEEGLPSGLLYQPDLTDDRVQNVDPMLLFSPKSFRFIPMTVMDNPFLLPPSNMTYLPSLLAQPPKNQLRFLRGSWASIDLGQNYFNRNSVKIIERPPADLVEIRAWDIAASAEPTSGMSNNPDYTAGVKLGRDKFGHYYVLDVVRFRKKSNEVIEEMVRVAHQDGVADTEVVVTKDPGAAGAHFYQFLTRTLAENGVYVRGVQTSGWTNKLKRFLPFTSLCESGNVSVVKAPWNEEFFSELEEFKGGERNKKDDQVDAVSDAFNMLAKTKATPIFVLPTSEFSKNSGPLLN